MERTIINLNDAEMEKIREFVIAVDDNKKAKGIYRELICGKNSTDVGTIAFGCEYALHKYLNMEYPFEIHDGGDKCDCFYAGLKIDVKSDEGMMKQLKVQLKDMEKDIDVFVAMVKWWERPVFEILGWITKADLEKKGQKEKRKYSDMWVMDNINLHDIVFLKTQGLLRSK